MLYILEKYKNPSRISLMKDFDSLRRISRGKFTYAKFTKLKELAKNTIGFHDENTDLLISSYITSIKHFNEQIESLESKISTIIKDLNPPILTIPGIGEISAASIIAEYGEVSNFSSPAQMLAFAGLEPSIIQSGTSEAVGKMVKHGSGHLRYVLMNCSLTLLKYHPIFYDF